MISTGSRSATAMATALLPEAVGPRMQTTRLECPLDGNEDSNYCPRRNQLSMSAMEN